MNEQAQTKYGSLFEALISVLITAPTSLILHWYSLELWGNQLDILEVKQTFIMVNYIFMVVHSFAWKFIIRRTFVKYSRLDPVNWLKKD